MASRGDVCEFIAIKIAFQVQNYYHATADSAPLYLGRVVPPVLKIIAHLRYFRFKCL